MQAGGVAGLAGEKPGWAIGSSTHAGPRGALFCSEIATTAKVSKPMASRTFEILRMFSIKPGLAQRRYPQVC
jgi:hypothetical protein